LVNRQRYCDTTSHFIETPKELQEVLDSPEKRIEYVRSFLDKPGYGKDVVGFMEWEKSSGRLVVSPYWDYVNGQMIGDMFWAKQSFLVATNTKPEES
jgi:hypothetical protein